MNRVPLGIRNDGPVRPIRGIWTMHRTSARLAGGRGRAGIVDRTVDRAAGRAAVLAVAFAAAVSLLAPGQSWAQG